MTMALVRKHETPAVFCRRIRQSPRNVQEWLAIMRYKTVLAGATRSRLRIDKKA